MTNQERNTQALIDHIQEQDRIIRRRNEQIEKAEGRADKAEIERADAAWRARVAEKHRDYFKHRASEATQPRPLTPDDITDAMVERARREEERQCGDRTSAEAMRNIITAALTEPPTRPEWMDDAERIEPILRDIEGVGFVTDPVLLSRHLAERGVRVTGAES